MTGSIAPTHSPQSPCTRFGSNAVCPLSRHLHAPQWDIDLTSHPKAMKQNSKSSGYSDDSSLLRCLSTDGVAESPAPQVRVRPPIAEDVVRAIDQQLT